MNPVFYVRELLTNLREEALENAAQFRSGRAGHDLGSVNHNAFVGFSEIARILEQAIRDQQKEWTRAFWFGSFFGAGGFAVSSLVFIWTKVGFNG